MVTVCSLLSALCSVRCVRPYGRWRAHSPALLSEAVAGESPLVIVPARHAAAPTSDHADLLPFQGLLDDTAARRREARILETACSRCVRITAAASSLAPTARSAQGAPVMLRMMWTPQVPKGRRATARKRCSAGLPPALAVSPLCGRRWGSQDTSPRAHFLRALRPGEGASVQSACLVPRCAPTCSRHLVISFPHQIRSFH